MAPKSVRRKSHMVGSPRTRFLRIFPNPNRGSRPKLRREIAAEVTSLLSDTNGTGTPKRRILHLPKPSSSDDQQ